MLDYRKFDEPGPAPPTGPAQMVVMQRAATPNTVIPTPAHNWKRSILLVLLLLFLIGVGGGIVEYEHQRGEDVRRQQEQQAEGIRRLLEQRAEESRRQLQQQAEESRRQLQQQAEEIRQRQLEPQAKINKVWTEHNVTRGGDKGMVIHTSASIDNLREQRLEAVACFYFDNVLEVPVKTSNQTFQFRNGDLCASETLTPGYKSTLYSDLSLFIPYSTIDVGSSGKWNLKYYVTIMRLGQDRVQLARSEAEKFTLTRQLPRVSP